MNYSRNYIPNEVQLELKLMKNLVYLVFNYNYILLQTKQALTGSLKKLSRSPIRSILHSSQANPNRWTAKAHHHRDRDQSSRVNLDLSHSIIRDNIECQKQHESDDLFMPAHSAELMRRLCVAIYFTELVAAAAA